MKVVVVGSGVVGTATGKGLARMGNDVTFVDVAPRRVDELRNEGFDASDEVALGSQPAVVFLALPTPNTGLRWDLSVLADGARVVGEALRSGSAYHTVVIRSTVPPGTCEGVVAPAIEQASALRTGDDFALAANPEFLRSRSALEDFLMPRMTVVGSRNRRTQERLLELLPSSGEVRRFDDPAAAELVKCAHNLYNASKISFWNELWLVGERLGIDVEEVAATVARSAEGSFNPDYGIRGGSPFGGACLPKDVAGFLAFAGELGIPVPLLIAVREVNEHMRRIRVNGRVVVGPHTMPSTGREPDWCNDGVSNTAEGRRGR